MNAELEKEFPWLRPAQVVASQLSEFMVEREKTYRGSWQKRGGVGAFMMLARKWDRIENMCQKEGYDIFRALEANEGDIRDDVRDLIVYLLLVTGYDVHRLALETEVRDDE